MGTVASKDTDGGSNGSEGESDRLEQAGGQLYVSLKMENPKLTGDLVPHVYGSVPLVGSWDPSKAVSLVDFHVCIFILMNVNCCYFNIVNFEILVRSGF